MSASLPIGLDREKIQKVEATKWDMVLHYVVTYKKGQEAEARIRRFRKAFPFAV